MFTAAKEPEPEPLAAGSELLFVTEPELVEALLGTKPIDDPDDGWPDDELTSKLPRDVGTLGPEGMGAELNGLPVECLRLSDIGASGKFSEGGG